MPITPDQMQEYQCHKRVRAFKIGSVVQSAPNVELDGGSWDIVPENSSEFLTVSHAFYLKHALAAGKYFVVYADGYQSISPADAFKAL